MPVVYQPGQNSGAGGQYRQPIPMVRILQCLLLVIGGALMFAYGGYRMYNGYLISSTGKTVTGKVTDASVHSGRRPSWFVTYSYTVDGRIYHSSDEITEDTYNSLKPGAEVSVTYAPGDPSKAQSSAASQGSILMANVLLVVFGIIFVPAGMSRLRLDS